MCYYRFVCATLLMVVASPASGDNARHPPSTISLHQSASGSDESFTPLYDGGGGGGGGALFPADEQVFAPTLPIPEKQVLELAGLRADIAAASGSGRAGINGPSRSQTAAAGDDEHHPAAQKIYPTFFRNIPPLGHSRPYYQSTEAAIEQQRFNKLQRAPAIPEVSSPLLGSGDFGVIKGGTFYYDTDGPSKGFVDDFYSLGYNNNNGHGRPQLAFLVQKPHQKEEQFSNFRDFADINISNDPAYSHHAPLFLPVPDSRHHEPENILDELRSLDREATSTTATMTTTTATTSPAVEGKGIHGKGVTQKRKKSTLVERKKRPKTPKDAKGQQEDGSEDYMMAAS